MEGAQALVLKPLVVLYLVKSVCHLDQSLVGEVALPAPSTIMFCFMRNMYIYDVHKKSRFFAPVHRRHSASVDIGSSLRGCGRGRDRLEHSSWLSSCFGIRILSNLRQLRERESHPIALGVS